MKRKTNLDNINVTANGLQFTFDTELEAQEFYVECQEKSTAAEIEHNKVTLLITRSHWRITNYVRERLCSYSSLP